MRFGVRGGGMKSFKIKNRSLGPGFPVYLIAEFSGNHHQNFEEAAKMLHAAKACGADAVKLQAYTPDKITLRSDKEFFKIQGETNWDGQMLYDLYSQACTPWEWFPKLKEIAQSLNIDLFATAFDPSAVDFLEELGVPVHKVASFEIVDIQLISKMAGTGKPLIISTGMATLNEIEEAVKTARNAGAREIALLKCTSAYPAEPEEMHLRTIPHLMEIFDVPIGLSDHTMGIAASVSAVSLGACIIEKHFTLSRKSPGPDSSFSLEPDEFKALVEAIRTTEKALGEIHYGASSLEVKNRIFRRSLFVVEDIKAGEKFTSENIRSIRPGMGLHTRHLNEIVGRTAASDLERGMPLSWDMVI